MKIKIFVALCAVVVLAIAAFVFLRRGASNEAHYAALEKQREEQAAQAPAAAPAASAAPVAQASPGASPGPSAAPAASAGRNYWTNFRGPKRDGNYDATPVLTNWPAAGLTALWKQPVGLGYA